MLGNQIQQRVHSWKTPCPACWPQLLPYCLLSRSSRRSQGAQQVQVTLLSPALHGLSKSPLLLQRRRASVVCHGPLLLWPWQCLSDWTAGLPTDGTLYGVAQVKLEQCSNSTSSRKRLCAFIGIPACASFRRETWLQALSASPQKAVLQDNQKQYTTESGQVTWRSAVCSQRW